MSIAVALVVELLVRMLVTALWPAVQRPAAMPVMADEDDEPVVDFERVRADLALIEELMGEGRDAEARDAVSRLLDVMDGVDEAAAADLRYVRWMREARMREARAA